MPLTVVVGAQWGDEGKGRIVDVLARRAHAVARFQGGPNAGHTVFIGNEKFILHLTPMGILNPHTLCCIGLGVLVNPHVVIEEINMLGDRGIDLEGRLMIDFRCHLILPSHIQRDQEREKARGKRKLGTTQRGIGPAYADRTLRDGITIGSFIYNVNNGIEPIADQEYTENCMRLEQYLGDVNLKLYRYLQDGKYLLAEGGQGTMLDLGVGTYPFVTSSNTIAGAASVNLGLGPNRIDQVICVLKAYTTRVGEGPFPTELNNQQGDSMRQLGDEFGATTGRPRRCGWLDGLIARYAARVNGADYWAVTKLDVLDNIDPIKVAVGYEVDGDIVDELPACPISFTQAKPVYRELPGWNSSTKEAKKLEKLPVNARKYLDFIEEFTEVKIGMVSVGSERESLISIDF